MSLLGGSCFVPINILIFERARSSRRPSPLTGRFEVLRQMDANGVKAATPVGHCRLTPLVPLILDCTFLYHFSVLLLFKLHSRECQEIFFLCFLFTSSGNTFLSIHHLLWLCVFFFSGIAPDVLLGHRERFRDLFMRSVVRVVVQRWLLLLLGGGFFFHLSCLLLCSLTQFFNRAREMEFFKRIIQIPDLPDVGHTLPTIFLNPLTTTIR